MTVSHLVVLLLPVVSFVLTGAVARELEVQTRGQLTYEGRAIAHLAGPVLANSQARDLNLLALQIAALEDDSGSRIELLDTDARIVLGSPPRNDPPDLADRAEITQALRGERAYTVRRGPKGCDAPECRGLVRVFVAVPVVQGERVIGAVRVSQAPARALHSLWVVGWPLILATILTLLATVALSLASAHILSRSLRALSQASHRIRDGSLEAVDALARPRRSHVAEVGDLSADVTEMTEQLQQRLGYISEFAGNVSHEFKTPITTLRGTVELLRDEPDMEPAQRERFLLNALADLERMERLVSGLLALARAEEGAARAPVDLGAIVRGLSSEFGEIEVEGHAGTVSGDATQLRVALRNLVHNALQHGGEGVAVRLVASQTDERAVIEVHDDGPGISAGNLDRVFDRFFTTGRATGRAGLGLAMVRAVARSHGGEVRVTSAPGATTFRLELPVVKAS